MKIPGQFVRILSLSSKKEGTFKLHENALAKILLDKNVRDRPVAVIAIVGPSRKGKSFLMNFLLRYMTAVYLHNDPDWLRDDDSPLEGFEWSGGSGKVTRGINLWSEPFLVEDLAVFFLDTQGTFDYDSSLTEDTAIFALSTLCSSVLIYNLSCDILSVDLMHLELFLNYGLEAVNYDKNTGNSTNKESKNLKPFHKLLFLIRDYSFNNVYGEEEGKKLMMKRFKVNNEEVQRIISNITQCFTEVSCFVMPPVGFMTSVNEKAQGKVKDIDEQFIAHLKFLAPSLLSPSNLVVKEVAGEIITAKQLFICFKTYSSIFNAHVLPQPKSIYEATAEINNMLAFDKAKGVYVSLMESQFGAQGPYVIPSKLESKHLEVKRVAIDHFRSAIKMGGEKYSTPYEEKLDRDLDKMQITFRKFNNRKNVARMVRTPLIFLLIGILCFVLANLFTIFRQTKLVTSCHVVMALSFATLVLIIFVRIQQIITD